jgi:hypothetical protein
MGHSRIPVGPGYRAPDDCVAVIVFWSMLAGAVIMLTGILFGVAITDINNKRTKTPEEEQ